MSAEAPAHKGNPRSEIIEAAYQLFLQRGYHGTSMRQIAQQAGTALGGIYNHFSSKEDIFVVVVIEHYPLIEVAHSMQAAQGQTIEELLRDAATRMVERLGQSPEFLNLMFIELVEFNGQHVPRLFEAIFPHVLLFAQRLSQWQSELRPVPLPILVRAFIGLFFSYFITERLMGNLLSAGLNQDAFDCFVDIYLHGILVKGETVTE